MICWKFFGINYLHGTYYIIKGKTALTVILRQRQNNDKDKN